LAFGPSQNGTSMRRLDRDLEWALLADEADFQRTQNSMHQLVYQSTDLIDVPKLAMHEVGGQFVPYPTRRTIKETPRGAQDVPGIRAETATKTSTQLRTEINKAVEDSPVVYRSTDPSKINPERSAYAN